MPRKLTHDIGGVEPLLHIHLIHARAHLSCSNSTPLRVATGNQKMYEFFGKKYCNFPLIEDWKKELLLSSIASMKRDGEPSATGATTARQRERPEGPGSMARLGCLSSRQNYG